MNCIPPALVSALILAAALCGSPSLQSDYPDPVSNPESPLMLLLPDTGPHPEKIDFSALPELPGSHAVVSRGDERWHYRLHTYLVHHDNLYWCMWSHGPIVEDKPTQHVRYATSPDGLHWSAAKTLVGPSGRPGFRHIARGFWVKEDGRLRALASHDEALKDGRTHFFGDSLELRSYLWMPDSSKWRLEGVVFDNTINNFPPKRLPAGEWMMTRRSSDRTISFLLGGRSSISAWTVQPFSVKDRADGLQPEEPYWYLLPDGHLAALARDNSRSGRLMRSFSTDNGRTWTRPTRVNFPDATSKFNVLRASNGLYILISNANPERRNPLCLSVSQDGLVYTALARLPIPAQIEGVVWETGSSYSATKYDSFQYPHAIEQNGSLFIAFSRRKQTAEVIEIPLHAVSALHEQGHP